MYASARPAGPDDHERVKRLLTTKFWPEHRLGSRQLPMAPDKVERHIRNAMGWGKALVAEVNGEIVGSLAHYPLAPWWTHQEILGDGWFFVDPEHRRSGAARTLLRLGREQILEDGRLGVIGVFNSHDTDRKERFFERMGWQRIGGWYAIDPRVT